MVELKTKSGVLKVYTKNGKIHLEAPTGLTGKQLVKVLDEHRPEIEALKEADKNEHENETVSNPMNALSSLNNFVRKNFDTIWDGANKIDCALLGDAFFSDRIVIGDTVIFTPEFGHEMLIAQADGWHDAADYPITEAQIKQTTKDIQSLVDAANK